MNTYIELVPSLLNGAKITIQVLVLSLIFTYMIAFIAGLGKLSKFKVISVICTVYIEIFRGTSLLVQLFWIYFVLPFFGIEFSPLTAGVIAMSLCYGAYASEVVRGAILSIPIGQTEAAIALNMTPFQRMIRIIIPQAFKIMLPGFGNLSIELMKGTSLVSLITLGDLTYQSLTLRNTNVAHTTEIFVALLVIYFLIALPLIFFARWLERRASIGRV
ncbi:ectoine/hydroxyectoine ABC transporter permease subunit EhuC [Neobacillus cucumis]|uniref:Ectoine/hydroxyectoine ABC transporter permease subunit EhuC n=1 Tax=Neobacillus cucumis TaxID=1740721 RepID=A0A2N5HAD5_9BACI|nr:ectoine/hydroxyectoine ABC transporter permease subunit EhuC [Neobacillus cucumis]